ncbi:uncharacterized protein PFL1_00602 [Pseudozyma flocculosa PF-1]|uniref:Mitochondrial import inner membrane translocase subunit n=1 Tax=Pseudozyma flocculosa TaxID=84751 RepID=A0A5C3ESD2_9BASI|nr:uncharacterized protein PFL1_00602 [Pseudozyma flocculosa PF-1]EPQ32406.1 hypothetical protein PFL1_00602 [Pseudozyma flocculosa PF-1]SPO34615.1 probable MRS11 - subunit of the Tim22-complex [Pseudozyma flocculosa]
MSFFGLGGGNNGGASPQAVSSAQIEAATAELDMITDVFNRLVSSCHAKCISTRYAEPDLNKGESVCIDRCVSKFFSVNAKVGEHMQQMGQAAQGGGAPAAGAGSFF